MAKRLSRIVLLSSLLAAAPLHAQGMHEKLLNTAYGRQARPVIAHLEDRVKCGQLVEVPEVSAIRGGHHDELTGEYSAGPSDKPDYLIKATHEGIHDLQHLARRETATKAEEFLVANFKDELLGRTEPTNQKILHLLPKFVASLSEQEKRACFGEGKLDLSKAARLFAVKVNELAERRRQSKIIDEIHANMFSHAGALSHQDFYEKVLAEYKTSISFEDFTRIKKAVMGLYLAFEGNHKRVARFVGRNCGSINNFLKEAGKVHGRFSEKQIKEKDEERRKRVEEALRVVGVEKAKTPKDLLKMLEDVLKDVNK